MPACRPGKAVACWWKRGDRGEDFDLQGNAGRCVADGAGTTVIVAISSVGVSWSERLLSSEGFLEMTHACVYVEPYLLLNAVFVFDF